MPFAGNNPGGTAGGIDTFLLPQLPETYAVATGPMYYAVLRTNGLVYERNRENVEDVIRVIGLRGEDLSGFIIRHAGGILDASASDVDFRDSFIVTQIAPTVAEVSIKNNGIVLAQIASDAVDTSKIVANSIVNSHVNAMAGIQYSKLERLPGFAKIGRYSASASASVQLNNIFSARWENYRIIITMLASANSGLKIQFSTGGTPFTSANYAVDEHMAASGGFHSVNVIAGLTLTNTYGPSIQNTTRGAIVLDIYSPFLTAYTIIHALDSSRDSANGLEIDQTGTIIQVTNSFDGITLGTFSGTFDWDISVYGYN